MKVVNLSALRNGRLYPQEILLGVKAAESPPEPLVKAAESPPESLVKAAESPPEPLGGRKDYVNERFPITPSGIEAANFRLK